MMRFGQRLVITCGLAAALAAPARAQIRAELITQGLSEPVAFAQDPSNPAVQLVAEKTGRVRVLLNGVLQSTDFLDLRGQVSTRGEQGLLGVAYAPDFAASGRVFLSFTDLSGHSVIARFVRAGGTTLVGDPSSRFDLLWSTGTRFIAQPFDNHNGGHIAFGADGYLYYGLGDGGGADDPYHNAQNPQQLLGKMLRIDVNVPDSDPEGFNIPPGNPFASASGVLPEVWDAGLRNPWRFSFDDPLRGGTGALLIADVGQQGYEEIDYEPAFSGGRNYGWSIREGAHDYMTGRPPMSLPLSDPIFEYPRAVGRSITGGFVYRGTGLGAAYYGRYFFADFANSRVWSLGLSQSGGGAAAVDLIDHTAELGTAAQMIASFGVDAAGELYVLNYGGSLHRMAGNGSTGGTGSTGGSSSDGSCTTPDPFAAIGGGTCVNGGWLPPGMAPPGSSTPAPQPSSSTGSCSTPDPFVALGGGTCINGGWLPPGAPLPAPPDSGTPSPPPAPPPSSTAACSTPDPFAALGGGTCVNGGWLPPGMVPPGGTTPLPPTTSPGGCTTPDPFVALGGGTCVNGGWLPPGMLPPSGRLLPIMPPKPAGPFSDDRVPTRA
jgi:glucose/arabinose dehydrogenase